MTEPDYSWIKVKKYTDDPTKTWEERYKALEAHHEKETKFLIKEVERLREAPPRPEEIQHAIAAWADETFGEPTTMTATATRANKEMAELLVAVEAGQGQSAVEEVADIVIVLCRLMDHLCGDIWTEVEKKMKVNRARDWKLDGRGQGYHVKPRSETDSYEARRVVDTATDLVRKIRGEVPESYYRSLVATLTEYDPLWATR